MPKNQRGHGEMMEMVAEWLEEGGTGTRAQIAEKFGVTKTHICAVINRLHKRGIIQVVGQLKGPETRGLPVDVIGYKAPPRVEIDVLAVIASQPDFVQAWNGVL